MSELPSATQSPIEKLAEYVEGKTTVFNDASAAASSSKPVVDVGHFLVECSVGPEDAGTLRSLVDDAVNGMSAVVFPLAGRPHNYIELGA